MRKIKAFSLIEICLALSLCSILMFVGVMGYHRFLAEQRLKKVVGSIQQALRYARHMAILQDAAVRVCGSRDHRRCDGDWSAGIIIWQNQQRIRVYTQMPQWVHVEYRGSFGRNADIVFNPMGKTLGQQGTFRINDDHREERLVLIQSGRVRSVSNHGRVWA